MKTLPFELLTLTFSNLSERDILQCQLTCKNWHEASVNQLYSKIHVNTEDKSRLLVRTLSNTSRLGNCVQNIYTDMLFKTKTDETFWDQPKLLNTLIKHCPNLLEIEASEPDLSFYTRVSYAATQGQLSRLSDLPMPNSASLESFIYTALLFKSSLTTMTLQDSDSYFGPDLDESEAYQTLKDQISEFENLQALEFFSYKSNKRLSDYDAMIEDCPHLKSIAIDLYPVNEQEEIKKFEGVINPRPYVHKLECNWSLIDDGSQLSYMIQKFPNLKTLLVTNESIPGLPTNRLICDDLIKFFYYTLAIPNFCMGSNINKQLLAKVWTDLMKIDDKFKKVTFDLDYFSDERETVNLIIDSETVFIYFTLFEDDVELPFINFLSEAGNMISSINIQGTHPDALGIERWVLHHKTLTHMDWVFQALRLCPLLQELTIPGYMCKIQRRDQISQHPQVRNLSIKRISNEVISLHFFEQLSFSLPNLKYFRLSYSNNKNNNYDPGVVCMPNARLDMFVCDLLPFYYGDQENNDFYLKLKTETGVKFYERNSQTGILAIDEQQYNRSSTKFRFEITCLSLAKLVIHCHQRADEKLLELIP